MKIEDICSTPKPRLLLQVCCAPCFCGSIEDLTARFDVTAFFYNPNIQPKEEFNRRLDALKQLIEIFPQVKLLVPEQDESQFLTSSKGLENEAEGGARCTECFVLRLGKTAEFLASHRDEYDFFATTLTVSPHKNAPLINEIGQKLDNKYGVSYLDSDFKKKDGYLRSTRFSKELGLYRQDYCGCSFSNWHLDGSNS
ncbi:MAG: epoxyqueuosine reductase QueH [Clostridia bacterium]|nr:epoxyqueuosine reductase QueH [Clostridia bacterium]